MPARDARTRVLLAKVAAAERWAHTPDRVAATAPARRGLRAKFERQVLDADPHVDGPELSRRADQLLRAHMLRLSLRSARSRSAQAGPGGRRESSRDARSEDDQ